MSAWTGATDALVDFLAQRQLAQRQAMLDAIAGEDRTRAIGREDRRDAREDARDARDAAAQIEAQANLDKERDFRRWTNVADNLLPGPITAETAAGLRSIGRDAGAIKTSPAVVLRVMNQVRSGLDGLESLGGAARDEGPLTRDVEALPETHESLGGTRYQSARAAAAEKAQTAADARTAAEARAAADRELRRELAGQADETRRTIAALRQPVGEKPLTPNQLRQQANDLRKGFEKDTKHYTDVRGAHRSLTTTLGKENAAGDVAAIFQFMKSLDPTSTVREGEFATAQNATGVPDRIVNAYNQIKSGTRLNPQQRKEFLDVSAGLLAAAEEDYHETVKAYEGDAEYYGIPRDRVIRAKAPAPAATEKPEGGAGAAPSATQARAAALIQKYRR